VSLLAGIVLAAPAAFSFPPVYPLPQEDEATYEELVEKGQALLRRQQYEEALKAFKRANSMRNKTSPQCLWGMARAYEGLGAHKDVIESCDRILQYAPPDDRRLRAQAINLKGVALTALAGEKDFKRMKEAEAAFRQALEMSDGVPLARYNLGVILLRQNRDAEGIGELKAYVADNPRSSNAEEARRMMANPRRARETFAPDFSLTTLQGDYLSLEELAGKVVVLDFWGTWCPPCVEAVPTLKRLHKKFADQPVVMVAISSDSDGAKWRTFVEEKKMEWPQYLDQGYKMRRAFQVNVYPTYIVIDREGVIRYRGSNADFLEEQIRKALRAKAQAAG